MITNNWNNKMLIFLILSVLFVNVCYATPNCLELHQSQLTALNERMSQMLSVLQTSPLLSKLLSTTDLSKPSSLTYSKEIEEPPAEPHYYPPSPTYATPTPSIVYMTPPQAVPSPFAVPSPPVLPSVPSPALYCSHVAPPTPFEYSYPIPNPMPASPWPQYYDPHLYTSQYPSSIQLRVPYPPSSYPPPQPYEFSYPHKPDYPPPLPYPASSTYPLAPPSYPAPVLPYSPLPSPYYPVYPRPAEIPPSPPFI